MIKPFILAGAVAIAGLSPLPTQAAGCVTGGIIGGVAGHMVGHGTAGAAAGCVIGHERAKTREREQERRAYDDGRRDAQSYDRRDDRYYR